MRNCRIMKLRMGVKLICFIMGGIRFLNKFRYGLVI